MTDSKTILPNSSEQDPFMIHLRDARQIVHSWPAWKQAVLGGAINVVNSSTAGHDGISLEEQNSSND